MIETTRSKEITEILSNCSKIDQWLTKIEQFIKEICLCEVLIDRIKLWEYLREINVEPYFYHGLLIDRNHIQCDLEVTSFLVYLPEALNTAI